MSALANSAGGQIIYGINENKKTKGPVVVDEGVTDANITRDWISQILNARIKPRLNEYTIECIDLDQGQLGFVISVPQSMTGPHQAPDNRYYRRIGVEVRAMEDYEVRDIMRRSTIPNLNVKVSLSSGNRSRTSYRPGTEATEPFPIHISIENLSDTPSLYALLSIGLDQKLIMRGYNYVNAVGVYPDSDKTIFSWYQRRFAVPNDLPIFKGANYILPDATFSVAAQPRDFGQYSIRTMIQTPGFTQLRKWIVQNQGFALDLYADNDD